MRRYAWVLGVMVLLVGCRKDSPPPITPHTLNGFGVGFYTKPDGVQGKKLPSEMKGFIAFEPNELKNYVTWCYSPDAAPSPAVEDDQ